MAYLDDYSDEDRARLTESQDLGGGAPVAGGTGGVSAASGAAPKASSGFANLSNYFSANQDTAGAQGEQMAAGLQSQAESALRSDDPGTAMNTLGQINAGVTPGGLATVANTGTDPNYTSGQAGLDAYLGTRGADPGRFDGLRGLYADRLPRVEAAPTAPTVDTFNSDATPRFLDWYIRRQQNIDGTELDRDRLERALWTGLWSRSQDPNYQPPESQTIPADFWNYAGLGGA